MRPTLILACLACLSAPAFAQSSTMSGLTDHTGMGAALESMRTRQAEYNQDQEEQRQKHRAILAEQQDQMLAERKARLQQTMSANVVQTSRAAQMMEAPAAPVAAPQMQQQPMMAPQVAAPNQPQMHYLDQDARAKELMAQSRAAQSAPVASLDDEEPVAAAPAPVVQPPVAARAATPRPVMAPAPQKFAPVAAADDEDEDDDTDAQVAAPKVTPPPVKQSAAKQSASTSAYKYALPNIRGVQAGR